MISIDETINDTGSLFDNYYVFKLDYTPKTYKFRKGQLDKMALYSKALNFDEAPNNFMLVGSCATGKTSVMKEYFRQIEQQYPELICLHIDCHRKKTEFKIYSVIYKRLIGNNTIGLQIDQLKETVINYITSTNLKLIIGLDDYELIRNRNDLNDIMYGFLRANEKYGAKISIITATSERKKAKLDNNVITVFNPVEVHFPKYSQTEIFYILKQRCEEGFYDGVINDTVINYIADLTFDRGDLRWGITLLEKAGINAEEDNSNQILIKHVY